MNNNCNGKILIVDDNPVNIQVIAGFLQKAGYGFEFAQSGKDAFEWLHSEEFDLVLLDVMMPEMDGFEVCRLIKKNENLKEIPIIFLTAKTETEDVVKGFNLGAEDYVAKPFKAEELLARVKTQIKMKQAKDEIRRLERNSTILAMAVTANHELNQPLAAIRGYLSLLENTCKNCDSCKMKDIFPKLDESFDEIKRILDKFKQNETAEIREYVEGIDMVVFEDND